MEGDSEAFFIAQHIILMFMTLLILHFHVAVEARVIGSQHWVSSDWQATLFNPMEPARLLCLWNFPGKNTGVPFPSPADLPDPVI